MHVHKTLQNHVSSDGTTKLLVELQDGQRVEAVIIKHSGRNTLCVSSQIGCQMACSFCATGTMGIIGNLMGGEILEQLYHASALAPIRNVVFMVRTLYLCTLMQNSDVHLYVRVFPARHLPPCVPSCISFNFPHQHT